MKSSIKWAETPTDVILLTCDGQGVVKKKAALAKLIRKVQLETLKEAVTIAEIYKKVDYSAADDIKRHIEHKISVLA